MARVIMSGKKLYYKIGEACRELDIQPYVLRYWETEFPLLKPDKSRSGQRVYSARDLAVIRRIKELLYEEGYTIAGAKKRLEQESLAFDESEGDSPELGELELGEPEEGEPRAGEPEELVDDEGGKEPADADEARQDLVAAAGRGNFGQAANRADLDTRAVERVQTMARRARELRSQAQRVLDQLKRFG